MATYCVRTINELPHRQILDGDRVLFTDRQEFEVENRKYEDDIYVYILRRILRTGNKGKTHWVVTYTTKSGMRASCHR